MPPQTDSLLDRLRHRRALALWRGLADRAARLDAARLRRAMGRARQLRRHLDRVIREGEHRLALPLIGADTLRRPIGCDWAWRPDLWRGPVARPGLASVPDKAPLAEGVTLNHDCGQAEIAVRQVRNAREADLAPFGLRLEVFRFDGSFLSVAVDLPPEAIAGLTLRHVVRLDLATEMERPLKIFARLNVRHGPNLEQIVREVPPGVEAATVEFDLAYTRMNERRIEKAWLDLILEGPAMNRMVLRDLTLCRRPRADL